MAGACIAATALSGCSTAQTLASQFGVAPLPQRVARKCYGTCPQCSWRPIDNCPQCRQVQTIRREAAGMTRKRFIEKYGSGPEGLVAEMNAKWAAENGPANQQAYGGFNVSGSGPIVPSSGRVTRSGNPYPVRWFSVDSVPKGNAALAKAILAEQLQRVHDPELAQSYLTAMENERAGGAGWQQPQRAQQSQRPQIAQTQNVNAFANTVPAQTRVPTSPQAQTGQYNYRGTSGYDALGY